MIEDYLGNIEVGIIELDAVLRHGEIIQIECDNGFFQQKVDSMQINRKPVKRAKKGDSIGIKTLSAPKNGGLVYKVI
ncbi:TPA: translation elongation factor-like protein [Candidatus Peregrinibacteria bacterium]|nr:translation elongation factor-like protein [Candidatus Peregrinibacteria bacterium]